jgi:hypothetical protein
MPRGPKGQKRPRDPNQLAKLIANIATGQVEDHETAPEVKRAKRVRSAKAPHDLRGSDTIYAAVKRYQLKSEP